MTFKVKETTKLEKIYTKYCESQGIDRGGIRFLIDGEIGKGEKTVKEVGLEHGDEIMAVLEQLGGDTYLTLITSL